MELGQLDLWRGNRAAVAAAKARAYLLLPPSTVRDIFSSAVAARVKLHRGAARLLSVYPWPADLVEPARVSEVSRASHTALVLMQGHEIV